MLGVLLFGALLLAVTAYLRPASAAPAGVPVSDAMLAIDAAHAARVNGLEAAHG